MRARRKNGYLILFLAIICCWSFTLMGAVPTTIKVGLESVYKNVQSISLTSDTPINIGYYDGYGFNQIGSLESQQVSISKANRTYYDTGHIYYSYQAAYEAAKNSAGIPVYVDQGIFAVYTAMPSGNTVSASSTRYVVKDSSGNEIFIFNKGSKEMVFRGYDAATGQNLTGVGNHKKYRGAIGIGGTTGITPYNILGIEEYLYGVVPGEMSPSWPQEALKAQAVAARSIAIYQYNRYTSAGYNVSDTTATQVYGGYTKEDARTTAAVDATKGQTIQYNGAVAEALYFSTSGGYTESAVNVWGSPISYLVGVSDSYETEPAQADWTRTITLADLDKCLAAQGANIGKAQGVEIISRTSSGRVQEMRILGTNGHYDLNLEKIRTFFNSATGGSLKSRLFSLTGPVTAVTPSTNPSGTGVSNVTILSANGTSVIGLGSGTSYVTNGQAMQTVGKQASIQSATGTLQMTAKANTSNNHQYGQSEIIRGDFTIYGRGFGHGVGMSQSGAKGMAQAGYDYVSILKHYYTGVTVQ